MPKAESVTFGESLRIAADSVWGLGTVFIILGGILSGVFTATESAAVAFDAWQAAKARGHDWLIVDTAGRRHTKGNLMEELAKIRRVLLLMDSRVATKPADHAAMDLLGEAAVAFQFEASFRCASRFDRR